MNLKINFLWMLSSKSAYVLAYIVTGALINRALGPSGVGFFAEMHTWVMLFMAIFSISIDSAIYHFANKEKYLQSDNDKLITFLLLNITYAIFALIVLSISTHFIPELFSDKTLKYILLLDILLVFTMLATNITIFFQALNKIKFASIVGIAQSIVSIGVIISGYLLNIISIQFVFSSMIIAQISSLIILIISLSNNNYFSGKFSISLAKKIIVAGLKQHIATISTFIYTRINQLIVFNYCGEEEAGLFAVALQIAAGLTIIPMTFQTILYPRVIHAKDEFEITIKSLRLGFYYWGAAIILIIMLAEPLLLMYAGNKFENSITIFRIIVIHTWFLPLSALISPYYIKQGQFLLASLTAVLVSIISIGLNYYLVPIYQGIGASLATSISCFIGFIISLIFFWYIADRNPLILFKFNYKKDFLYLIKNNLWLKK